MRITHMTPAEITAAPAVDLDWYLATYDAITKVEAERQQR